MNCLIAAATITELKPFLEAFRSGQVDGRNNIDILITGIGMTAATYSLTRQVMMKRPEVIIQAGIGGSFDNTILLGTVFAIRQEVIGDQGVMEKGSWKNLAALNLVKANQFPWTKGSLVNRSGLLKKTRLKKVNGITVNEISTDTKRINYYKKIVAAGVESMEGAALHYVGLMEKIPFLQIRAMSNYVGERDKKKWDIPGSITQLNNELLKLLESL